MGILRTARASASSSALALTVAPAVPWELHEVRVHLGAAGAAGALTVTMDAGAGSKHDTLLYTQSMGAVTHVEKTWETPPKFTHYNDQIDIAYANGGSATYGIEVVYKLL